MSEIVQVETPDGDMFWVRLEAQSGPTDVALRDFVYRLDDLPGTLRAVVGSVRSGLRAAAPDEFTLEFGIELSVKSGLLVSAVTGSGGKATLKVSATWKKDDEVASATAPRQPEESDDPDNADEAAETDAPADSGD